MEKIIVRKAIADTGCCQTTQGLLSTEPVSAIAELFGIVQENGRAQRVFINRESISVEEKVVSRSVWEVYGHGKGHSRNLGYEEPRIQKRANRERARNF